MTAPAIQTLVFGGTFDPLHHGHLIVARAVAEAVQAERILLVPAAANPLKGGAVASGRQRLEMCRLAVQDAPLFEVSDIEINRQPPSYTMDTVEQLKQGGAGELGVVIGADMVADLPKWHRVGELLDAARLIVIPRPPQTVDDVRQAIETLRGCLSAGHIQALLQGVTAGPMIDISATDIRRRVADGRSIQYLTPPEIVAFIAGEGLYSR